MEIQSYCDKETQYRNTSVIHHAPDLARLHHFNCKKNCYTTIQLSNITNTTCARRTMKDTPSQSIRPAPRKMLKRPPIPAKRTIRHEIKELEHPRTDDHTTYISSDDESEHGYCHQSGGSCGQ